MAQADTDGKKIVLLVAFTAELAIPLSCDVVAVLPDQTVKLGWVWVVQDQDTQSSGSSSQLEAHLDALDASVKFAEIILTPNPEHIEHLPEVTEIWGKQMLLKHVPIERLDLEAGQERGSP